VLSSIEVTDFRCIRHAKLEFHDRGTGIVGGNAAGKTSLLEAIFFLAHGRSFRTATRAKLIRRGADFFRIVATLESRDGQLIAGAEHGAGETKMRLGGQGVSSVSDVAEVLPIQVIDPGVHRLVDEGSARRRRLLDWGVFHVKHNFLSAWRRYQRALSQRNTAIREDLSDELIRAWDPELVEAAQAIDQLRRDYSAELAREFEKLGADFLGERVELEYRRGWDDDTSLGDALAASHPRNRRHGTTTVGAHRADLIIRADGVIARDRVSRGQQKVLAAALILAQIRCLARLSDRTETCLLLDDPAAELDVDKLGKLLRAIDETPAQLVVCSVTEAGLNGIDIGRKFHVEQGEFGSML
jgi:DNA replication and repair protein RecF